MTTTPFRLPRRLLFGPLVIGIIFMLASLKIISFREFLPQALIEIGACLALLSPLMLLERRIETEMEIIRQQVEAQAAIRTDALRVDSIESYPFEFSKKEG